MKRLTALSSTDSGFMSATGITFMMSTGVFFFRLFNSAL